MKQTGWPEPAAISELPGNHRRAVGAALGEIRRQLEELERIGAVRLPRDLKEQLQRLERAARPQPARRYAGSVLAALKVHVDELEPERLAAYGSLSPDQRDTLRRMVTVLRRELQNLSTDGASQDDHDPKTPPGDRSQG